MIVHLREDLPSAFDSGRVFLNSVVTSSHRLDRTTNVVTASPMPVVELLGEDRDEYTYSVVAVGATG